MADHRQPLVSFPAPWTSPFTVDSQYPYHLINREGHRLFILNKTAWTYFGCKSPEQVLESAKRAGVNVLRVALEGRPYFDALGIDLWPWRGTRSDPDWSGFNDAYWHEVERRVRLAGERGLGFDLVLYMTLKPADGDGERHRPYWEQALARLGKYANVLTWEIANEYTANEAFQDQAGMFFKEHDPYRRPVCTSDGTTDDAVWPDKPWMGLVINHSCTSSTERHGLKEWYWAVAANTRAHGKPAFCNESGREIRHKNDDPVHRRKQAWIWCTSGGYWTLHSWGGCEGIDDPGYQAPGEQYLSVLASYFRSLPFWQLAPNHTALTVSDPEVLCVTLAHPERRRIIAYVCTLESGAAPHAARALLRLPPAEYRVRYIDPEDGAVVATCRVAAQGWGKPSEIALPAFVDDLLIDVEAVGSIRKENMEGTG